MSLAANETGFLVAVRERRAEHIHGSFDGVQRTLVDCARTVPDDARADEPALIAVAGRSGFAFAGARCGTAAHAGNLCLAARGPVAPGARDA